MGKVVIEHSFDSSTNNDVYTLKVTATTKIHKALRCEYFEQIIADQLVGNILREINKYDGHTIVERPEWSKGTSNYDRMVELLQAYVQKYGPLE